MWVLGGVLVIIVVDGILKEMWYLGRQPSKHGRVELEADAEEGRYD